MDSRRHFLRGLARTATGAGTPATSRRTPDAPPPADAAEQSPAAEPAGTPPQAAEAEPTSRYAIALSHAGWGSGAQEALSRSEVLVIGAGALGTPVLGYFAGAGVGRLGVLDDADVALTDLRAETVHYTPDVGVPKAHSAAAKLGFLNPEIVVEPYQVRLEEENADGLLTGQHLVVDCSNDAATQAVVAQTCARLAIALVTAGSHANGGWVITVPAGELACLACAGTDRLEARRALVGAEAGVVGSLQAREALRRLSPIDEPPEPSTLHLYLEPPELRRVPLVGRADCPACGSR